MLLLAFLGTQQLTYAQLTASINSATNLSCNGDNTGAVDINVSGGVLPYSYSWSNGDTTQDVSGLSAGTYSVTVTDALLATATAGTTLTQPAALLASKIVKDVSCNGGTNGFINLTVSGGTAPYSFLWNTSDTTEDIINFPSGSYDVTITDANGCTFWLSDTIGEPSEFLLIAPSHTNVSCFGGSNGATSITPVGGILPYTYSWSNGGTTKNLTNVPAGTYNLTASDNNGCKAYETFIITQPAQGLSASVSITNSSCYFTPDGGIDLSVSGGVIPYSYLWNTGAVTEDLAAISAGNYSVTITDANGCTLVETPTVLATDTIAPIAQCRNITSYLDASGSISIAASDLDNGSSDNCSLDTILLDKYTFTCADLGANSVQVFVFDSNGNSDTCSATITVLDTVSPTISADDITVYLDATGNASITAADVDSATFDACGVDTLILDTYQFTCASIGIQTVSLTAIDVNGNQAQISADVTVRDTINPVAVAQDLNVYLDANGQATLAATAVDNGSSDICGIDDYALDLSFFTCADLGVQTLILTVTDMDGNTDDATASITVIDSISPVIDPKDITVYLDATGQASIAVSDVTNSTSDACGMDTTLLDQYSFGCAEVGVNSVQIFATDLNGNNSTATSMVTVLDTNSPQVVAKDLSVYLDAAGQASITVGQLDSLSSAICGVDTVYLDTYNFTCNETGLNKVALIAGSVNGVQSTDTGRVTVLDTIKPNVTAQNLLVYLDAAGQASITAAQVKLSSSDICGMDTLVLDVYDFTCAEAGLNTVSLTATDANGNSAAAQATVEIRDTISPVISSQNISVYLDVMGQASIVPMDVLASSSDNCGIDTLILDIYDFGCSDTGSQVVNILALDASGNQATASAQVTIIDTIVPSVVANDISVYLDQNGQATIVAADMDGGSATACGMDTLYISQYNFDCSNLGANSVALTAINNSGQTGVDTGIVSVYDTLGPNLNPMDITVYLNANGEVSITLEDIDPAVTDGCGLDTAYLDQYNFTCTQAGANVVSIYGLDIYGNGSSATAIVTLMDTIAPEFTTNDITLYLDAAGVASLAVLDVATAATDTCGVDTMTLDRYTFGCADAGINVVNVSAQDVNGNSTSKQANVTVMDSIKPVVSANAINVYLDANGQATVAASDVVASATDICGIDTLLLDQMNFDCSMLGANSVNLAAFDPSGNFAVANAVLTVFDTVSPVLSSSNVDIYLDTAGSVALSSVNVGAYLYEACTLDTLYFSQEVFACVDLGANRIAFTAIDASGNRTDDSLTVTVRDTTPPVLVNQNLTVYLDATGNASITPASVNTLTSDVCGIDSIYLDRYNFSCADIGDNTVLLTAVDLNGTPGSAPATVTVVDTIQPVVKARNITIYVDSTGMAKIKPSDIDQGSFDGNCSYALNISDSIFDCGELGLNLESLTITDGGGNSQSVDFFVTVLDTISPTLSLQNITVVLNANGNASITAGQLDNGSMDNCTNLLYFTASKTQFSCSDIGTNTVAVTAMDGKLNTSTANATVTVEDGAAPVVSTNDLTVYLDASGVANALATDANNGTTDNCALDSLWLGQSIFTGNDLGQNVVKLYARDLGGNISNANCIITVLDTTKPVISAQGINVYLNANGQAVFNGSMLNTLPTDNHAIASVSAASATYGCANRGVNPVMVTATDISGNTSTALVAINVMDTISPVVMANNYSVYLDAAGTASITTAHINAGTTDNCGVAGMSLSQSSFGCADIGSITLSLSAQDASGNIGSKSFTLNVMDTMAPQIINIPADVTVDAAATGCGANVNFGLPAFSDNCGAASLTSSHQSGSFFPIGKTEVQFIVQDGGGNADTAYFNVTVEDNSKPVITSMPASDTVGACQALYSFAVPTATDNCTSSPSVVQISGIPSGGYYPIGSTTNSFQVKDANGNDTMVSFTVVVMPLGQPDLPNKLNLCENDDPVDFSQGQNLNWSGKGMVNPSLFDPSAAGPGLHLLGYAYVDKYGCTAQGSVSITVSPKPTQPVISRIGSTTLSTGAYDTYQWYRDGVAIPGATSQSYSYTQGGNYQVMVTNTATCENYSIGHVVGEAHGGIGIEENLATRLSVYPNPTAGVLNIDLNSYTREELELSLYSISGQQVLHRNDFTRADGRIVLDLGSLPKSTYILHISSKAEVVVKQIVIY